MSKHPHTRALSFDSADQGPQAPPHDRAAAWATRLAICMLVMAPGAAWAEEPCFPAFPEQVAQFPNPLVVPAGMALGPIATVSSTGRPGTYTSHCPYMNVRGQYMTDWPLWNGTGSIHETNVPGIGMRIQLDPRSSVQRPIPGTAEIRSDYLTNPGFIISLYKIGRVSSGTLEGRIAYFYDWDRDGARPDGEKTYLYFAPLDITEKPATCNFRATDLAIDLGKHTSAAFTGPQAADVPWTRFSIDTTSCTDAESILLRFSGIADPGAPQVFAVNGGATGIGIALETTDGQKVIPNDPAPLVWPASTGPASMEFRARYQPTGTAITPGDANGMATVNVSYR